MTPSDKAPWYPWFPRDFAADEPVQLMDLEAEGAYRRLLDHQWLHGSIPSDLAQLARICKNTPLARMRAIWSQVAPLFHPVEADHARLQNAKLERIRAEQQAKGKKASAKAKLAADALWEERRKQAAEHSSEDAPSSAPGNAPSIGQAMHGDAIPEAEAEAEAVNSGSEANASGGAESKATSDEPTVGVLIAHCRKRLWAPDGKPPAEWTEGREISVYQYFAREGFSNSEILCAIEGLYWLQRKGLVDWLPKGQKLSARVLYKKSGFRHLFGMAADAGREYGWSDVDPVSRTEEQERQRRRDPADAPGGIGNVVGSVVGTIGRRTGRTVANA